MEMTYTWFWRKKLPDRKNTDCLILARGKRHTVLVEFKSDGYQVVTSRYAVRIKKGCAHVWGIDGLHQNEYCKKCFITRESEINQRVKETV